MPQLTKLDPYANSKSDDKVTEEKDENDKPLELQDFQGLNNDLANNLYYNSTTLFHKQIIQGSIRTTRFLNGKGELCYQYVRRPTRYKNNKTSEELVLYLFLGVFVIFGLILCRAGKYTIKRDY